MANYEVPQAEVDQLFKQIPAALTQHQIPFVFGPNYILHRYEVAAEREGTVAGTYPLADGDASVYSFPVASDTQNIDQTYTKLYLDNAYVKIADLSVAAGNPTDTLDQLSWLKITTVDETTRKKIRIGDALRLTCTHTTDAEGKTGEAPSEAAQTTTTYRYVLITAITQTTDSFYVAIDEDISEFTDDGAGNSITTAVLCEVQHDVLVPRNDYTDSNKTKFSWQHTTSGGEVCVSVVKTLKVATSRADSGNGEVLVADVYLSYRELSTQFTDGIHSLVGASSVVQLGTIHPDNPLAQAVYNAALNAGGQQVNYMAVESADYEGFARVLDTASLTKDVYFMVPVTRESDIIALVKSHVEEMSNAQNKRWRIAFVSDKIPLSRVVYDKLSSHDDEGYKAKITKVVGSTAEVQFVRKSGGAWVEDSFTRFKRDVRIGDTLRLNLTKKEWGVATPDEYRITKVLSNSKLRITASGLTTNETPQEAEIHHEYRLGEMAEVIRDNSSQLASRRIYNIFPDSFSASGVTQTGEFAAACVAGLVASCLPQQPVTNLALTGIDDVPDVYGRYSFAELNTIASGGTFIIMQNMPNDQVYVRHQISTDYESNNINTAELSITKNLDSISYYLDNAIVPYIGKYNITRSLILSIRQTLESALVSLADTDAGLYGPQIIAEGTSIVRLEQDAELKDRISCDIEINMPYPFNRIVLKLYV